MKNSTETEWKTIHANESCKALDAPLMKGVIEELMDNLSNCYGVRKDDGMVLYGLKKVAMYAAQISRAQCLGFDPELLRMTNDEANEQQMRFAEACVRAGKPVILTDGHSVVELEEPTP